MSKVYIFLAEGFEEVEALTVVDLLRRAEIDITMVSIMDTKRVAGAHGITIEADELYDDVNFSQAKMLVLPGGMPGTKYLGEHEGLVTMLKSFNDKNKLIAAICAAPSVLGVNGILKGKKATSYPGFEDKLVDAVVSTDSVVNDQNIITSRGLGTAIPFALKIIERLKGKDTSKSISESIIYTS